MDGIQPQHCFARPAEDLELARVAIDSGGKQIAGIYSRSNGYASDWLSYTFDLSSRNGELKVLVEAESRGHSLSSDGNYLATLVEGDDSGVLLTDTMSGAVIHLVGDDLQGGGHLVFTSDDNGLALYYESATLFFWDLMPLRKADRPGSTKLKREENNVFMPLAGLDLSEVAIGPQGAFFAMAIAGGDWQKSGLVILWDVRAGKEVNLRARGDGDLLPEMASVAFSPNGHFLVSSDGEMDFRVWDIREKSELVRLVADDFYSLRLRVKSTHFSPDGIHFASVTEPENVVLWSLPPRGQDLIDRARAVLPSPLYDEECERSFLSGFLCQDR